MWNFKFGRDQTFQEEETDYMSKATMQIGKIRTESVHQFLSFKVDASRQQLLGREKNEDEC